MEDYIPLLSTTINIKMGNNNQTTKTISLEQYGIENTNVRYQLSPEELSEITAEQGLGKMTSYGAVSVNTGKFTGRSPKDRFIVKDAITKEEVWWGDINLPFSPEKFDALYDKVVAHLSKQDTLYARDCFACAKESHRKSIRVITELPWSSLFAHNMFLRPTEDELEDFHPEWTVINAPGFFANPEVDGTRQENFAILNFTKKTVLIGGTGYTGEIKKGIFSALNFILPVFEETLPMHCSANVGENGETAIFFGLSGTGKTTLSADPKRKLIGDDEHGWTADDKIFNFEGGCYAKVINLSKEGEPDIYNAIRPNALLENVIIDADGNVDFADTTITPNTRVSYPITHINNIQKPSVAGQPKNIFFLTADAFGVLPPISKLTPGQAAYHFISGYTAKVAGTEAGVVEPEPSFSACFGAPFLPLHPTRYADMLSEKMLKAGVNVWLINTGWTGGPYGVGSRMKLAYTRAMITAVMNGELENADFVDHPVFKIAVPQAVPNVPSEVLNPRNTWSDKELYDKKAVELAKTFKENFKQFEAEASQEILNGAPKYD